MRQSLSSADATSTATGDRHLTFTTGDSDYGPHTPLLELVPPLPLEIGVCCYHCAFNSRLGRGRCVCWGNLDHVLMLLAEERLRKQMFCAPFFSAFVEENILFSSSIGFPKHRNSVYLLGSLEKGHESTTSCI